MALLASRSAIVARPTGVRRAQLAVAAPLRTSHIARAKTESCDLPIGEPAPYFEVSSVLCKRCHNVHRAPGCSNRQLWQTLILCQILANFNISTLCCGPAFRNPSAPRTPLDTLLLLLSTPCSFPM